MPLTLSGSTGISGIDGSVSQPSYVGVDTNTGIYFPAADTVAVSVGGTEVMSLNSTGGNLNTSSINGGPLSGARNRIINGGMDIWQRATTATGAYTSVLTYVSVDRWAVFSQNSSTTLALSTSVPTTAGSTFQYSLKLQRPSGNTGTGAIFTGQGIESVNCYDLSNQTVTLSFWIKAGANYSGGGSCLTQVVTGTVAEQGIAANGSWTGRTTVISQYLTPTTTWTKYSYTGTFGSGVLETLVQFGWSGTGTAGADDSIYITGVQLEAGTVATPFERRSYGQELALCQRYYSIVQINSEYINTLSATILYRTYFYPVTPMRTSPTCSITTAFTYLSGAIGTSFTPTFAAPNPYSVSVRGSSLTTATGFNSGAFSVDAEL